MQFSTQRNLLFHKLNEKGKEISLNMNQTGSADIPAANMQANTWPKNPTADT